MTINVTTGNSGYVARIEWFEGDAKFTRECTADSLRAAIDDIIDQVERLEERGIAI